MRIRDTYNDPFAGEIHAASSEAYVVSRSASMRGDEDSSRHPGEYHMYYIYERDTQDISKLQSPVYLYNRTSALHVYICETVKQPNSMVLHISYMCRSISENENNNLIQAMNYNDSTPWLRTSIEELQLHMMSGKIAPT